MVIAVYCGSSMGADPLFEEAARELGTWIGRNGHSLVYGGGTSGLMGVVAGAAKEAGAHVTGVVPGDVAFIANRPQPFCDVVVKTLNMNARKQKMLELADVFVALPGGIGTIDEISEAITLTKIGVFNKKAVLLNKNGFYEPFRALVQKMADAGFLHEAEMSHLCLADDIQALAEFIAG